MDLTTWLGFVLASVVVLTVPGPTIIFLISLALNNGKKFAFQASLGVALGDFIAITFAVIGVGGVIIASAFLFTMVKIIGGIYLIYIGYKTMRKMGGGLRVGNEKNHYSSFRSFTHSAVVTALNPKPIMFFIAFVPLFIDPSLPYISQVSVIIPTFVFLAFLNACLYSVFANFIFQYLLTKNMITFLNRLTGGLLMAMGVGLLNMSKPS